MTSYTADQVRETLARHYIRYASYLRGRRFPDPRNQDQLDRGIELEWRAKVLRREMRRIERFTDAEIEDMRSMNLPPTVVNTTRQKMLQHRV